MFIPPCRVAFRTIGSPFGIPRSFSTSSLRSDMVKRGERLTKNSTPWLTTRRRTCPICKGDVVRSLQRANGSTSPRYTPYEEDQSEDEQDRVAATRNESPSAERPISPRGDEDVEQGVRAPTPRRDQTSGSWLQSLTDRIGLTNSTPAPEEDRRRD